LVSVTSASHAPGQAYVADAGDAVLKIPIAATSLHPAPQGLPSSKLSLDAIRDLVRLAVRGERAWRPIREGGGPSCADAEPPSAISPPARR
jgi:hypothetical protein